MRRSLFSSARLCRSRSRRSCSAGTTTSTTYTFSRSLSRKAQSHYGNQSMFGTLNRIIGNGENISPRRTSTRRTSRGCIDDADHGPRPDRRGVAVPVGQAARLDRGSSPPPGWHRSRRRRWRGSTTTASSSRSLRGCGSPIDAGSRGHHGCWRWRASSRSTHSQRQTSSHIPSGGMCCSRTVFRRAADAVRADAAGAECDQQHRRADSKKARRSAALIQHLLRSNPCFIKL